PRQEQKCSFDQPPCKPMRIAYAQEDQAVHDLVQPGNEVAGPATPDPERPASAPVADLNASAAARSAYPAPAELPTQEAPRGIRFDFNLGARVIVPAGAWRVRPSPPRTRTTPFEA